MGQHPLRVGVLSVPFCPVPYASAGHTGTLSRLSGLSHSVPLIARIVTRDRGRRHRGSKS